MAGWAVLAAAAFRDRERKVTPAAWSPSTRGTIGLIATLGVIALIAFYIPQRWHFWGGWDDYQAHDVEFSVLWSQEFDGLNGRPLLGWSFLAGNLLAGGAIEGHLWFAAFTVLANALLLMVTLWTLAPQSRAVGAAAAVIYLACPVDPLNFYPLWAANAHRLAVTFVLASFYLFALSWIRLSRPLLLTACIALGVALLMYEVGYLLAALPVAYAWLNRKQNEAWRVWIYCWIATWSLFLLRVAIFQLTHTTYQQTQAKAATLNAAALARNFAMHLKPAIKQFRASIDSLTDYWTLAIPLACLAASAIWWFARRMPAAPRRQTYVILAFALAGIMLGVAPFSHIRGIERTQFFAAPFHALAAAAAIYLLTSRMPHSTRVPMFALLTATLAANGLAAAIKSQTDRHDVAYEEVVHAYEQIHAVCPQIADDTLVLLDAEGRFVVGSDYNTFEGSHTWLGGRVAQVTGDDAIYPLTFQKDAAVVRSSTGEMRFSYDKLVAFRIDDEGTLYFHSAWPEATLGSVGQSQYEPLKQMPSAPITPLSYLNLPSWMQRSRDVLEHRNGAVFGIGWSSRKFADGWTYRELQQDAELLVNSQGKTTFALKLDLAPTASSIAGGTVGIINRQGALVAEAELRQRQIVKLDIPCNGRDVELVRIRFDAPGATSQSRAVLRAYCHQTPLDTSPLEPPADVVDGGLRLGPGWYANEIQQGAPLRWLNTDGAILTGPCDPGQAPRIELDAACGPGMAGKPCQVQLVDDQDAVVGAATIIDRQTVAFDLPVDLPEGSHLKLRVLGGGAPTPGDPRTLNLMVTRCQWLPSSGN